MSSTTTQGLRRVSLAIVVAPVTMWRARA